MVKPANEYERLSAEILQDQKNRITLFTFCITTIAAIIGFSNRFISTNHIKPHFSVLIIVFAVYAVLMPSVLLTFHSSSRINLKSEYLKVILKEKWMQGFDELMENIISKNNGNLPKSHYILMKLKVYSSENIFKFTFHLLNLLVTIFALTIIRFESRICTIISITIFITVALAIYIFRPVGKKEYRRLWKIYAKEMVE